MERNLEITTSEIPKNLKNKKKAAKLIAVFFDLLLILYGSDQT